MPRVVFRNANLIDGSGAPRPNTSLVVEGDPGQDLSLLRPPENLKIVMKSGQMIETGRPRARPVRATARHGLASGVVRYLSAE